MIGFSLASSLFVQILTHVIPNSTLKHSDRSLLTQQATSSLCELQKPPSPFRAIILGHCSTVFFRSKNVLTALVTMIEPQGIYFGYLDVTMFVAGG